MFPHGVATRVDLLAYGVSSSTISRNYYRILPQIYGEGEPTAIARCYAITLWQPTALLSHRTAAWLYGWVDEPTRFEATVSPKSKPRIPTWITIYRRALPDSEGTEVQGLPVVARERTLIDCTAVMKPEDVARIVDERLTSDVDPECVDALIRSRPGMRGNRPALRELDRRAGGFASEPERVLDRALIAIGLRLRTNEWVGSYVCDFVDLLSRVIVEVDGRTYHSAPAVFSRDRRRQNKLVLDGWLILRYSAFDVMSDPHGIAREIAAVVRRRREARR